MLLDTASLYFRAFHAIPTSITAPDGRPVNAVRGFLDLLGTVATRFEPSHLVACLDADWRPDWRVKLVPTYKAHRVDQASPDREAAPDELGPQVEILLDVLSALGVATADASGYEADDVIATLATRAARTGTPNDLVDVVTGDRDLFALVRGQTVTSPQIRVLYPVPSVAKLSVMDSAEVQHRYGIPPERYADVATLRGDSSDGLPGVAGVGEKTAVRLITEFGSLAALMAACERGDGRLRESLAIKLLQHREYLAAAWKVVGLVRDIELPAESSGIPAGPADPRRVTELAQRHNLANPIARCSKALFG
ncbi:MAG: 5'-3' exonuclease [Mycobacteriales bacterium]